MSKEMSQEDMCAAIRKFVISKSSREITVYTLGKPGTDRSEDDLLDLDFGLACFPMGETREALYMEPFGKGDKNDYYRRIFEMDFFNLDEGSEISNIDRWRSAMKVARRKKTPVFSLTFGKFEPNGECGIFLHVRTGIPPQEAFYFLNKFAQGKLFGDVFDFK